MFGQAVAALRLLVDAASADVRIAIDLSNVGGVALDVVEHEAFAKREIAQREIVGAEISQEGVGHQAARDDQIGAARIEPGKLEALGEREAGQFTAKPAKGFGADAQVAHFGIGTAMAGRQHAKREQRA